MNADEAKRRVSNVERLWAFFQTCPRTWVDARDLEFAGRQAWRSRVSELRQRLERDNLGSIENRQCRINHGATVISQYRFLPYKPLGRDSTKTTLPLPLFDQDAGPWSQR